jgi:hypothetical protein
MVVCSIKVALRSNSFHENNTIDNVPPLAAEKSMNYYSRKGLRHNKKVY